jgi:hypothetical protein
VSYISGGNGVPMSQIPIPAMVKPRRRKRLVWSALLFLLFLLSLSGWVGYR